MSRLLKIHFNEAKVLINKYFTIFPQIKIFMDEMEKFVIQNKYALSPLDKRRIDFSMIDWDNSGLVAHVKNQAKNFPFQGCGASVTKLALVRIAKRIKDEKINAKLINVIHDKFCCV